MKSRVVALGLAVLFCVTVPALAQSTPPSAPSVAPTVPPGAADVVTGILQRLAGDAVAGYGVDPNHVRGIVTYFRRFDLQIQMPLNQYKDVHLHQGTIIDPRGASLQAGQALDVRGHANPDGSINADAITILHE